MFECSCGSKIFYRYQKANIGDTVILTEDMAIHEIWGHDSFNEIFEYYECYECGRKYDEEGKEVNKEVNNV